MRRLGLDYLDLYLIHWPVKKRNRSWKLLEQAYRAGTVRALGVSNFTIRHLEELRQHSQLVPAVNQVEFHPYLFQKELLEYCTKRGIRLEAYSPLAHGRRMENAVLDAIATKHKKSSAQVMIRWSLQLGNIVIPKSTNPTRIAENFNVFDFKLAPAEMQQIAGLNENLRTCWNPENQA